MSAEATAILAFLILVTVAVIDALIVLRRRRRRRQMNQLARELARLDREARALFDGTRFIRPVAANATGLRERIATAVKKGQAVRRQLPEHERGLLDRLAPLARAVVFERYREQANQIHADEETRKERGAGLAPRLTALDQEASAFLDGKRYVRHWVANGLRERIAAAVEQAQAVRESLSDSERELLEELAPLATSDGFKGRCEQANLQYEAAERRKRRVAQTTLRLAALDREICALFDGKRYVRHSSANTLREHTAAAVEQGKDVRKWLSQSERRLLNRLVQIASPKNFEQRREQANTQYVDAAQQSVRESCHAAGLAPTDEQAEAIAIDEDVTLVLAGAGTGKTTTIIGKVAHLVSDQGVRPDEILVLAFNSDAAEQIRERLPVSMAADASTFHSFGNRVLGREKLVSDLASDDPGRRRFIQRQIESLLLDPSLARPVHDFITNHLHPYRSPFDFDTEEEYNSYVRGVELRALSGKPVRSFEELAIANFLTLNGVRFHYERAYSYYTDSPYRPDFYVPLPDGGGVYIEHFALNRDGSAPWPGYAEGVRWKQRIHRGNGTILIETYSWQHGEGTLLQRLKENLEAHGITFHPLPPSQVIRKLRDAYVVSRLTYVLDAFLQHVRSGKLTADELRQRAADFTEPIRAGTFLQVFEKVRQRYERQLTSEGKIDFHDQIHGATERICDGRWQSPYRYVLVDEFQDISAERMELLAALRGPDTAFFLVGDDWQSINRFAGSDVSLVRDSGKHLGHVRERALTQTFRFGPGVSEPSTAFIRRNPTQTQRALRPVANPPPAGDIAVLKSADPVLSLGRALDEISNLSPQAAKAASVLVLGRYIASRNVLQEASVPPWLAGHVRFSTVHSAKGLEYDFVVVLDLVDKVLGFPCRVEDDPLLDLVTLPVEPFLHAEERRVFYVALTRGKRGAWLIADAERPSAFVNELLHEYNVGARYRVRVIDVPATESRDPFDELPPLETLDPFEEFPDDHLRF